MITIQSDIIDLIIILIIIYSSVMLWRIGNKKNKVKLLYKMISIFLLVHLVIFPLTYKSFINNNPESIEIDNEILNNEKHLSLDDFHKSYNLKYDKHKITVNKILSENKNLLNDLTWDEIGDKRLLFLKSHILLGYTNGFQVPGDVKGRQLLLFDLKGNLLFDIPHDDNINKIENILNDYLVILNKLKNSKTKRLNNINSNTFWSYRSILPYTLNVIFNDNFNPKSKGANLIYFIHNLIVAGFLLTFIMQLFQNFMIKNDK
jgi:hypothetical protein